VKLSLSKYEFEREKYCKREEGEDEVHHALLFMLLHLSNDMALHPRTR
jgi:hypothetical protein